MAKCPACARENPEERRSEPGKHRRLAWNQKHGGGVFQEHPAWYPRDSGFLLLNISAASAATRSVAGDREIYVDFLGPFVLSRQTADSGARRTGFRGEREK